MDVITRFFQLFDRLFEQVSWKTAFGEPQRHGEKTLIPVASVSYGFGLGGFKGLREMGEAEDAETPAETADAAAPDAPAEGEGGGGGGGGGATPVALIEITPQRVCVRPIIHWEKVILAFLFMICWTTFFGTRVARQAMHREECECCR